MEQNFLAVKSASYGGKEQDLQIIPGTGHFEGKLPGNVWQGVYTKYICALGKEIVEVVGSGNKKCCDALEFRSRVSPSV